MSKFTQALIVSPLADGKSWVVLEKFPYHVGSEESTDIVTVDRGFVTDFASVPRLFWIFIPRWGKYGNAAVIHDWLYWDKNRSRKEADQIFKEGMGVLNVSGIQKAIIYYAVRWFGWIAWHRNAWERHDGFDRVIDTATIKATIESQRPNTIKSAYTYYTNAMHNKAN